MTNAIPEFRSNIAPYAILPSLTFSQSAPVNGALLPVLGEESSNIITVRIYNNFELQTGISTMNTVSLTVFGDPLSESWIRVYQTGFGEGTTTPGLYTQYTDLDTPIGNSGMNKYVPAYGSDGSTTPHIRAGSTTNGCGFIEFAIYIQVPEGATFNSYNFEIGVEFT